MLNSRRHAEWLSLIETSGPFLSIPVLHRAFPQGLDAVDTELFGNLRQAFSEWETNREAHNPDPAVHSAWIRYVLRDLLNLPDEVLCTGQAIPAGLQARMESQGETLRPDFVVINPTGADPVGKPRLLIQHYPAEQHLEKAVKGKLWNASPATRMTELLHATATPLGLVTNGDCWMLVYAPIGETTGFASWYSWLWIAERITWQAFLSLLGVERFFAVEEKDTLDRLYHESASDQHEVTDQLGYQVRRAVEVLVQTLDRIDKDKNRELLAATAESDIYEAALTVMMRLVFLFSAEERGLFLLGDPLYDESYAVSTLRAQLREAADLSGEEVLEYRFDAWCRLLATWRAVYGGVEHDRMQLPAYGGRLFDPDRFPFLEGRPPGSSWHDIPSLPLRIDNRTVLHLLEALQVLEIKVPGGGAKEARLLSFRALDIEQIGHVYEGLLDHTANRATEPVASLRGTKDKEPEIALSTLEGLKQRGGQHLVAFLKEETGRSLPALQRDLDSQPSFEEMGRYR